MLTPAPNALLKTLEEPPDHVVFVLATTDPQKVLPTIRSRTQHFEFRLLSPTCWPSTCATSSPTPAGPRRRRATRPSTTSSAGAAARPATRCRRSTRWRPWAGWTDDAEPVDAVLDALCERDAGAGLVAVADALAAGRDPRPWARTWSPPCATPSWP